MVIISKAEARVRKIANRMAEFLKFIWRTI